MIAIQALHVDTGLINGNLFGLTQTANNTMLCCLKRLVAALEHLVKILANWIQKPPERSSNR
jgi:hypothetical protein